MLYDMKRILTILLITTSFNIDVSAKGESADADCDVTFGIEWGYVATIQSGYHYNFFAPEGYRVDDYGNNFGHHANADMYFHIGYDMGKYWNLSLYAGYAGIGNIHKAIPVSIRATRYFNAEKNHDRWFMFMDAGSRISIKKPVQEIAVGKIGGGYRLALSRSTGLDFLMSARMTYTHPEIIYDKQPVSIDKINRCNAFLTAISLGISLTF